MKDARSQVISTENDDREDKNESLAPKPRIELKIEKVSLKTGLRGGIHDADKPGSLVD